MLLTAPPSTMVRVKQPTKPASKGHLTAFFLLIALGAIIFGLNLTNKDENESETQLRTKTIQRQRSSLLQGEEQEEENDRAALNSARVRAWRHEMVAKMEDKKMLPEVFASSSVKKCKHVFLDFGSNVGDALHKMVDSFLPPVIVDGKERQYVFNTTTGDIGPEYYGFNGFKHMWVLPQFIKEKITSYNAQSNKDPVYPEDYCFYGIEGNPFFTPMLREQEILTLNMNPRPVQHVHFLTEHVGTAVDGPTTLFLDTSNAQQNYWGSSILDSHVDVARGGREKVGANVMGITLTTLLERTALAGGHVMIKIDIEGAEYQLLEEAVKSNIFCKLVKEQGVQIDILNEFHGDSTIGSEEPRKRWEEVVKGEEKILNCGVDYKVLKSMIPMW